MKTVENEHTMILQLRNWAIYSLAGWILATNPIAAEEQVIIERLEDLARCNPSQLDALFSFGTVSGIPTGRLRGLPLVNPGSRSSVAASQGGRLAWSGKRIDANGLGAINFFFGIPSVRANTRIEPSLRDGRPAIVLDYSQSSFVYRNVRDEIREISPGIFLGYVDDTRTSEPTARRWFGLESAR